MPQKLKLALHLGERVLALCSVSKRIVGCAQCADSDHFLYDRVRLSRQEIAHRLQLWGQFWIRALLGARLGRHLVGLSRS